MRRPSRRARASIGAAAVLVATLGWTPAASAQQPAPRSVPVFSLSSGFAFPSGGDLNDTYAPGPYVASALTVGVARRLALRLDAGWSSFAPAPAPKHVERDSRTGYAGEVSLAGIATVVERGDRPLLYALLSGGRARVGSTWLNANNVVEPFSHAELWSWELGAGSELTRHLGVEIRRVTAHRGSRGVVGYIPIGVRVRL